MIKIVGKIDLSQIVKDPLCRCDECNEVVNTSFGDPREEVFRIDENGIKYGHRMLCPYCLDELFGEHQPKSIFE